MIIGPFMILGGGQELKVDAVRQGEKRGFRAAHSFFHHNAGARAAEPVARKHGLGFCHGLIMGLGHHHAFTGGQTIRLNHGRKGEGANVSLQAIIG